MSPDPLGRLKLRSGDLELELVPGLGGAVAAYRQRREDGWAALFRESPARPTDVLQTASFPLVPFCNRIRDGRFTFRGREIRLQPNLPPQPHPLHGQGWRNAWRLVEGSDSRAELAFAHPAGEWPWAYEARQVFRLDEQGLEQTLSCRNLSDGPMPCGLGFHPFLDAPADTILDTRVNGVWTVDDEIMPVNLEPPAGRYRLVGRSISGAGLDNGYEGWCGEALISWPSRGGGVRISSEAPRFQVYAPASESILCAEPVTNANDVFSRPESQWSALGIVILEPGEETALTARFDPLPAR